MPVSMEGGGDQPLGGKHEPGCRTLKPLRAMRNDDVLWCRRRERRRGGDGERHGGSHVVLKHCE